METAILILVSTGALITFLLLVKLIQMDRQHEAWKKRMENFRKDME